MNLSILFYKESKKGTTADMRALCMAKDYQDTSQMNRPIILDIWNESVGWRPPYRQRMLTYATADIGL
jgi:hypothetical protein